MKNFWQKLGKPFTILAPMDGVTDFVFRQIVCELGRPGVFFTEFTSTDGLVSKGRDVVSKRLDFGENEKPIVAQIWGSNPKNFYESAKFIKSLGFDGIDINMGCPASAIIKGGSCSKLIKQPKLAAEIIQSTKDGSGGLPVSVKTRVGYESETIDEWIRFLLKQNLSTLTVHLRTVKELSKVPAHWEYMPKIIRLRDEISPKTLIVGNGDLTSMEEIEEKYKQYGCDGFMVGRGIFQNPWMFNLLVNMEEVTILERLNLYLEHIKLFKKVQKNLKNFGPLKKFCKTYISNFPGAIELRGKIMEAKSLRELEGVINGYKLKNINQHH